MDLLIIGGGPGGYTAAIRAAQLGLSVGVIERESILGGTCLRVGCIPSKAMLESSERYYETQHALPQHGVKVSGVELDLATMFHRKEQIVSTNGRGIDALFKKNKITRYAGNGRIAGPSKVIVEAADQSKTELASSTSSSPPAANRRHSLASNSTVIELERAVKPSPTRKYRSTSSSSGPATSASNLALSGGGLAAR